MEDRLDKLEKLILAKNKETMERFDRFRTHNTEAIRQLQEDNSDMKSELQILAKNKQKIQWIHGLESRIQDLENLERAKQERNAKNENSAWNRMKKLVSKDELENKYIVD